MMKFNNNNKNNGKKKKKKRKKKGTLNISPVYCDIYDRY